MAPSDPSDTVLAVCLRVRQSGALRVFVALVRIILDLWAAPPQCGYWGSMGSFCSAPQDFGLLGFFCCARFPPREASIIVSIEYRVMWRNLLLIYNRPTVLGIPSRNSYMSFMSQFREKAPDLCIFAKESKIPQPEWTPPPAAHPFLARASQ